LVIQSDLFNDHPSITILPVTSELRGAPLFRVLVEPDAGNRLHKRSQVMVDKARRYRAKKWVRFLATWAHRRCSQSPAPWLSFCEWH